MVLYTIIPLEKIFEEEENELKQKKRTLNVGGAMVEVVQSSDNEFEIVKLISSNPTHYLDPRFQPGKKIALQPWWN